MKDQPTNSNILHPQCGPLGFIVGDWNDINGFYAAVPCRQGSYGHPPGETIKKIAETHLAPAIHRKV